MSRTRPLAPSPHLEQDPPWEWRAFELGDETIVAHGADESTPDGYRVDGTTRNVRRIARADAVLYDGTLVEPVYEEDYGSVVLQHFYVGRMESLYVEDWLDEPVPVLEALDDLGAVPVEAIDG